MPNISMVSSNDHPHAGYVKQPEVNGVGTIGSGAYWSRRRNQPSHSLSGSETELNTINGVVSTHHVGSRETMVNIPAREEFKV